MKYDWSWHSSARGAFRCGAFVLAILLLAGGILRILQLLQRPEFVYDTVFKTAVAWLGYGIIFLLIAYRGRLFIFK